jgi:hypothetical protein
MTVSHYNLLFCLFRIVKGERTHKEVLRLMVDAEKTKTTIKGVKGFSPLACLENFDLVWSSTFDQMHTIFLGVVKDLLLKYIQLKECIIQGLNFIKVVDECMKQMKSMKEMSRPPQNASIADVKSWKATQFKDFLLHFGPVFLRKVLKPNYYENFLDLSQSVFIFNKEKIEKEEFIIATQKILKFVAEFEVLFGETAMRYNVHILNHIPMFVIKMGPLYSYSLFCYESKNHFLNKFINGTNNVIQEATTKISLFQNSYLESQSNSSTKFYKFFNDISICAKSRKTTLNSNENALLGFPTEIFFEIKHFYKKGIFFKVHDGKTSLKNCDSFIQTIQGNVGYIEKILISETNIVVFLNEVFGISSSYVQLISIYRKNPSKLIVINGSDIKQKLFLFEEELMCTFWPNNVEIN